MMIFSLFRPKLQNKSLLLSAWLITLLCIPLFSFFGRTLQLYLLSQVSGETLGKYMGFLLAGFIVGYGITLLRSGLHPHVWHLLWIVVLLFFLFRNIPYVEKVHVVIFGLLGFLSQKLFTAKASFIICASLSLLDEVFQYFLPNRVGDIRDVGINLFSAILGLFLAFLLMESRRRK